MGGTGALVFGGFGGTGALIFGGPSATADTQIGVNPASQMITDYMPPTTFYGTAHLTRRGKRRSQYNQQQYRSYPRLHTLRATPKVLPAALDIEVKCHLNDNNIQIQRSQKKSSSKLQANAEWHLKHRECGR
jgi:hypothetical protein